MSLKYFSSLSMSSKGEKKREKERKEKKQQYPGDQMRLGLGGLLVCLFSLIRTGFFLSSVKIVASCEMNLENFPMDTQKCMLIFGSCE